MQTSQFSVMPLYEQRPPERESTAPPRIVGYQVSNQVTARVREIDRLGAVLDALVSAGATNIDGPWFDIADPAQVLGRRATPRSPTRWRGRGATPPPPGSSSARSSRSRRPVPSCRRRAR